MSRMKVEEVSQQIRGVSYGRTDAQDKLFQGAVPILRANNIQDGKLIFNDLVYVPKERASDQQLLKKNDIVIAASSGSLDIVGKAAQLNNDWYGAFGAFCKVIRPNAKIVPEYLGFYFQSEKYRKIVSSLAAGANINNLRNEHLDQLELEVPEEQEQKKIVQKLKKISNILEKRRQSIAKLDQLAQSIFLEMFVYSKASQKWPEVKIEDLAANVPVAMRSGPFGSDLKHSEFVAEGVAVLGIDNVATNEFKWGERRFITEKKYQELKRYTIRPRDVLITIMATIGRTCVVPDNIPLSINTKHLAALTIDPNKGSPYFISKAFLYHPDILGQLKISEKGAIMAGLNLGIIKGIKLKIPPIDLQNVYEKRILKIREMRFKLIQSLNQVEELQQSLSQKFFN